MGPCASDLSLSVHDLHDNAALILWSAESMPEGPSNVSEMTGAGFIVLASDLKLENFKSRFSRWGAGA